MEGASSCLAFFLSSPWRLVGEHLWGEDLGWQQRRAPASLKEAIPPLLPCLPTWTSKWRKTGPSLLTNPLTWEHQDFFFKPKLLWSCFISSATVPHWPLLPGGACLGEVAMGSHAPDLDPLSPFAWAPSLTHTEISQLRRNSDFSFLWHLSILFICSPKNVKMSRQILQHLHEKM